MKNKAGQIAKYAPAALSYVLPVLLVAVLLWKLGLSWAFGDRPKPQIPQNGYVANEDRVKLSWRRGDYDGDFVVQVARGERFDDPIFQRRTASTSILLPRLNPGDNYCWRVLDSDEALVSCFRTSEDIVPY